MGVGELPRWAEHGRAEESFTNGNPQEFRHFGDTCTDVPSDERVSASAALTGVGGS